MATEWLRPLRPMPNAFRKFAGRARPSLRDLRIYRGNPSVETLGYSHPVPSGRNSRKEFLATYDALFQRLHIGIQHHLRHFVALAVGIAAKAVEVPFDA